ncbi:sulfotransferase 1A1-like isoform X2 [Portunus trituberculatus]|uniref:sulfotransferase 1A1-like isoform X2 n=1 Tax=Portunus trituberculatus TaxID=210409 RepID=UPI001E1CD692|nr:sulfotransferase 1A1-like isoform X2 [Portunus trituberculatus]
MGTSSSAYLLHVTKMKQWLISGHEVVTMDDEWLERIRKHQSMQYKHGVVRLMPEGWLYPATSAIFLDKLQTFEFRSEDVLVVTFPKCGTTWMQEILWTMLHNPNLDNPEASKEILIRSLDISCDMMLDGNYWDVVKLRSFEDLFNTLCPGKKLEDGLNIQCLEATPGRRVIKSHFPLQLMRKDLLEKTKVVYVARNPKDAIVSYYHFMRVVQLFNYTGSFEEFTKNFMNSEHVYMPYWPHMKAAWDLRHHPNMHFVFFEDMKSDIMAELKKLNEFTQANLSLKQLESVADYTTFSKMKARGEPIQDPMYDKDLLDKYGAYFRKGSTGDWKKHFTPELLQEVDQWIEKNVEETGICFK